MSVQIGSVKTMSYLLELTYISKLEFNLNVNRVLVFFRFQEQCKSCTFNYIVSIQKDFSGHWTQISPYFCILTCYIQGPVEKQNNELLKTGISFCLLSCQWHHCEHQQSRIISARVCNGFSSGSRSKIRLLLTFCQYISHLQKHSQSKQNIICVHVNVWLFLPRVTHV